MPQPDCINFFVFNAINRKRIFDESAFKPVTCFSFFRRNIPDFFILPPVCNTVVLIVFFSHELVTVHTPLKLRFLCVHRFFVPFFFLLSIIEVFYMNYIVQNMTDLFFSATFLSIIRIHAKKSHDLKCHGFFSS